MATTKIILMGLLALSSSLALAFDHAPLQDFCVAEATSQVLVNGLVCKDPKQVQPDHFSLSGLHIAGNTSNQLGSRITPATVAQIPGLNTLGISMVRIDFAPMGLVPPHAHPRATEIVTVLDGSILVGFVTSNPENRLVAKTLNKGDVFAFPKGLIHFQYNVGSTSAVAIAALNSQNPGVISIANTVFGSKPDILPDVLTKAFQLDKKSVDYLQTVF